MKNHLKTFAAVLLLTFASAVPAQENQSASLELAAIQPYDMQIMYDKTSHLIFPSAIRYVDLGSDALIASKAPDAQNVLRVKAAVKDFKQETNFSVITDEGRFYSFNVQYNDLPISLSYDLQTMQKARQKPEARDVLFQELGNTPPSQACLILQSIYKNDKRTIKHIGSESFGIQFLLKGLYIQDGKYYFHTQLVNRTNVPFQIDFVNFKVIDKKTARRTAVQQKPLFPLRIYKELNAILGKSADQNVFLLDQFTLSDDKVLIIEVFEKNGGRHQLLKVKNSELIKAKLISDMHLNLKF